MRADTRPQEDSVNSWEQRDLGKTQAVSGIPTVQAHAWQGYWPHIMHNPCPQV